MEEWEYLKGHKDLYKEVMMEKWPSLTSPDGSRNTPERCPRPLDSQHYIEEHQEIPQTRPLHSQDSTQEHQENLEEHHEIPQKGQIQEAEVLSVNINQERCHNPLYSQESKQEHQEVPQKPNEISQKGPGDFWNFRQEQISQARSLYCQDSQHDIPQDSPLYSDGSIQEDQEILQDNQGDDTIQIKIEVINEEEDEEPYEDIPADISRGQLEINEAMEGDHASFLDSTSEDPLGEMADSPEFHLRPDLYGRCLSDPSTPSGDPPNRPTHAGRSSKPSLHFGNASEHLTHVRHASKCFRPMEHPSGRSTHIGYYLEHSKHSRRPADSSGHFSDTSRHGEVLSAPSALGGHLPNFTILYSHLSHPGNLDDPSAYRPNNRFVCSECGKSFFLKLPAEVQRRVRRQRMQLLCPYCKQSFAHRVGLEKYCCSECGKRFIQRSDLVRHFRSHTGEKPFECPVCGKHFSLKGALNVHRRSHTGERPYACTVCGKGFARKVILLNHERIHTGEKPFPCLSVGNVLCRRWP